METTPIKLTPKQRHFIAEYLKNGGNATQAALEAYNCTSYGAARAIGSENLTKPNIRHAIDSDLMQLAEDAVMVLKDALDATDQHGYPDWRVRDKAIDQVFKLSAIPGF